MLFLSDAVQMCSNKLRRRSILSASPYSRWRCVWFFGSVFHKPNEDACFNNYDNELDTIFKRCVLSYSAGFKISHGMWKLHDRNPHQVNLFDFNVLLKEMQLKRSPNQYKFVPADQIHKYAKNFLLCAQTRPCLSSALISAGQLSLQTVRFY